MEPAQPAVYPYASERMQAINSLIRVPRKSISMNESHKWKSTTLKEKMSKNKNALITSKVNPASLALSLGRPLSTSDIQHFSDTELDQFYQNMLTNNTFQISTGENDHVREMMQIAATRPKELKKFGFSVKKNIKLTELSTDMKLQENDSFKMFRSNGSRKFVRLSKLIIVFTPGQTSASKFDARIHFALIDSRVIKANEIIRESYGNLLYSTMTFMDSDYFIPMKEFDDMFLRIKVPGTGLKTGKMWGSVWLHIELETTDSPTQRPISPVRLVPTIPVTSLMTRGNQNPTKYDGYLDTESLITMAESCKVVGQVRAERRGEEDPFEGFNNRSGVQKFSMFSEEQEIELSPETDDLNQEDYIKIINNLKKVLHGLETSGPSEDNSEDDNKESTKKDSEVVEEYSQYEDEIRHSLSKMTTGVEYNETHQLYNCQCPRCSHANLKHQNLNTKRPTKPFPKS